MKVLVTGGSGYLGQFIVKALTASHTVALTFSARALTDAELQVLGGPKAFQVDLKTGSGLEHVLDDLGPPDVVVNCAAISIPRECEKDPEAARAINVPQALLRWLVGLPGGKAPLLVHLSTDQVFDGSASFWKEGDEARPANSYGASKVAAEELIRGSWPHPYAILRSSVIVGPAPPVPLPKGLPLQWIDGVLASGQATDFFGDEFRCPVFVLDVVRVVELLMAALSQGKEWRELFNLGGPDRLSRAGIAEVVARVRGHSPALIKTVPAASVNRGVASPPDISMDVTHLTSSLGITLTSFEDAVRQTFGST